MPDVESPYPQGTPAWVDLMTTDRGAAARFYSELLGWTLDVSGPEYGNYTIGQLRGRPVAGIGQQMPGQQVPTAWTTYLAVDDADAVVAAARSHGGTVLAEPMDVMQQGRMAILEDPSGGVVGIWQAGQHYGAQVVNEPGAVVWNELLTRDTAAAREFYEKVLGVSFTPLPGGADFDYTTLDIDGRPAGGLGILPPTAPPGAPSHWLSYFQVADADATVAKARDLGGQVEREPTDTMYGRQAILVDPTGGRFAIMQVAPQFDPPS